MPLCKKLIQHSQYHVNSATFPSSQLNFGQFFHHSRGTCPINLLLEEVINRKNSSLQRPSTLLTSIKHWICALFVELKIKWLLKQSNDFKDFIATLKYIAYKRLKTQLEYQRYLPFFLSFLPFQSTLWASSCLLVLLPKSLFFCHFHRHR